MISRAGLGRLLALLLAFALIAAACGDSDDSGDAETGDTAETTEAPDDGASTETTVAPDDGAETETTEAADDGGEAVADGEPIKIGVQNPEGDPAGSFPEYSEAARAASEYINAELGGIGGRPIELIVCEMAITPDDSQRCANELVAEGVDLALSSLNFFGNHFPIYQGAGIPVLVGTPITVADFTSEGVYAISPGGGCLGAHTALIFSATQIIPEITGEPVNRVAVPWADTPPGVVCYYDLESKPLDVIAGNIDGDSVLAGSNPELEHIGVPVLPAQPDVTPQATEVLGFDPDVIIFSAQGSDCWTFVDALGRLGWTPDSIPLVLSGSCIDFDLMGAAGDLAVGVYFTTVQSGLTSPLDTLEGKDLEEATIYQTKGPEYGLSEDNLLKGFGTQGFSMMMNIWEMAGTIDGEVTAQAISEGFAATDGTTPVFGSTPLNCSGAPAPYVSVCSSDSGIAQWDGTSLAPVDGYPLVNGTELLTGTELLPGPYETN